VTLC